MQLKLEPIPDRLAICRLEPDEELPSWVSGDFVSLTRTKEELSIVCRQELVPEEILCEQDWRGLRVVGQLDFTLVGIIASLTSTLAERGVSVYVVSTYDTDYLLIKEESFAVAKSALAEVGHTINE